MGKCAWCDSQFRVVNKLAAGGYISVGSRGVNNKKPAVVAPMMWNLETQNMAAGGMIKRADGSYSKRGLWDNIRANIGSGKKPTKQMLEQEKKIRAKYAEGGMVDGGPGDGKRPAYSWSSQTAPQPQLQIPSIVPDYTMADQLRFEEEKGKQREKKDEKANRELGKFLESNIPGMNNMIPEDAKKWMFNNIRPIDYPSIEGGIKAITSGLMGKGGAPPQMDAEGNYSIEEEAWAKALGLNIPSKYIIPSEYKPTKAKDPNSSYYKLRPDIIDPALILDEAKNLGLKEGDKTEISSLAPFVNENFMDPEAFSGIDPLQGFQISVGRDEKGKYVAIYDKYDFEGPLNSLIKPYEFYDRFYFPNQGNKQKNNSGMQVVQKKSHGGEVLFPEMFGALGDPKNLHLHDGIYAPTMGSNIKRNAPINRHNQFVGPPEFKYTYGSGGLVHLLNYYPGMGL